MFLQTLKWIARISSIISMVLLSFLLFDDLQLISTVTFIDVVLFIFFPIGVITGMLLSWRWELTGAAISVFSLIVFYTISLYIGGNSPKGFYFLFLVSPSFIYLIYGILNSGFLKPTVANK